MEYGRSVIAGMVAGLFVATSAWGNGDAALLRQRHEHVTPQPSATQKPSVSLEIREVEETKVSGAWDNAFLREIVLGLAPPGWKVVIDTGREEIKEGRWNFYTATERRQALADLLSPLGMTYRFFPQFKDKKGNPEPVLLVADEQPVSRGVDYHDYE